MPEQPYPCLDYLIYGLHNSTEENYVIVMKMSREGTLNHQRLFTDLGVPGYSDALYFSCLLTGVKVLAK